MNVLFQFLIAGALVCLNNQNQDVDIVLVPKTVIWNDSTDMNFKIRLVNKSSNPTFIFDQILDDVYHYVPSPLDNLEFVTQRMENNKYENYRDRSIADAFWNESRLPKELIDSISKTRDPLIKLMPNSELYLDYSFEFGRFYPKGEYRTKVVFKYDYTGLGKTAESDWVYFKVTKDLFRPTPKLVFTTEKLLFWRLK